MGNQLALPNYDTLKVLPTCCQQTLKQDTHDLRAHSSASLLLMQEAKIIQNGTLTPSQSFDPHSTDISNPVSSATHSAPRSPSATLSNFKYAADVPKLQSIDSDKSLSCGQGAGTVQNKNTRISKRKHVSISSLSEDHVYSMESSDSENDEVLSNEKVLALQTATRVHTHTKKKRRSQEMLGIAESTTTAADHQSNFEQADVTASAAHTTHPQQQPVACYQRRKKNNGHKKYKGVLRAKQEQTTHCMGTLKKELSECEIKLRQSQHEKDILKRENQELRAKIAAFVEKYTVVDSGRDLYELSTKTSSVNTNAELDEKASHCAHLQTSSNSNNDLGLLAAHKLLAAPSRSHSFNSNTDEKATHCAHSQTMSTCNNGNDLAPKLLTAPSRSHSFNSSTSNGTVKCVSLSPVVTPFSSSPGTPLAINWNNSVKSPSAQSMNEQMLSPQYTVNTTRSTDTLHSVAALEMPMNVGSTSFAESISHGSMVSVVVTADCCDQYEHAKPPLMEEHHEMQPDEQQEDTVVFDHFDEDEAGDGILGPPEEEDEEDELSAFSSLDLDGNQKCGGCAKQCAAIQRIIRALQWYSVEGDDHERVYQRMKHRQYGHQVVCDYNHIMEVHLNDQSKNDAEIRQMYNEIVQEISDKVGDCTFADCAGYKRYLRGKRGNVHQAQVRDQHEVQTYVNTMDGIHCCFVHLSKALR
eukprot:CAMPEP_0197028174 /NCGR_PEP_ID=MMETSP1384-20130603/7924_1 /TAXON_ID=29189 /ORGANISM="Ammonia sp." /LENGTH=695 /DNA_ID=CAMNT_0042457139 /DNA_START=23 /DNA_END=2110 /DNA_ORIENTATION=+